MLQQPKGRRERAAGLPVVLFRFLLLKTRMQRLSALAEGTSALRFIVCFFLDSPSIYKEGKMEPYLDKTVQNWKRKSEGKRT